MPALCGGVFGLLGGYLTDCFGRRRVLVWSILLYAFSAFAAGFSTSLEMLLVLRCFTFVGVCVEFVAAVAWLAELFPERDQRETVLGYTQAFSSFGGLLVTGASAVAVGLRHVVPGHSRRPRAVALHADLRAHPGDPADRHPAVPARVAGLGGEGTAGTLVRPSFAELFQPAASARRRS